MDSRHKISTDSVTTKKPHSPSFTLTLTIISLMIILLSLETVQTHPKTTQISSSSLSPILTTSFQPSTQTKNEITIYCSVNYGPTFGTYTLFSKTEDIFVSNENNQNKYSYTAFLYSFVDTTGCGSNTFTIKCNFTTNEIKVYLIT
jgi:hypothetical protein